VEQKSVLDTWVGFALAFGVVYLGFVIAGKFF
jgi:hypothetical protein